MTKESQTNTQTNIQTPKARHRVATQLKTFILQIFETVASMYEFWVFNEISEIPEIQSHIVIQDFRKKSNRKYYLILDITIYVYFLSSEKNSIH